MDNTRPQLLLACTLPLSLHLAETVLGFIGVILSIVALAIYFRNAYVWALMSGVLAFASGLQGLLVDHNARPRSGCFQCHGILAGFNLVNLAIFGVACLFLINPIWVIWAIATFATELSVTIVIFCCSKRSGVTMAEMELPTAQPNGANVVHGHPADAGFKQPYML